MKIKILVFALFAIIGFGQTLIAADTERSLTVSGFSETSVRPDQFSFDFTLETESKTVAPLYKIHQGSVEKILQYLRSVSIPESDLHVQGFSIEPVYDYQNQPPRLTRYVARTQINIDVQSEKIYGQLLDGLTQQGVTSIRALTYGLRDRESRIIATEKAAFNQAKRKAKSLAESAGMTLGPVLSITEENQNIQVYERMALSAKAADTASPEVPIGNIPIQATLKVTFELKR